jgi:glycosyltransferase involved in cell wall biosynthesis
VSHFLREETIFTFGCTGCDVYVIHNFVDPEVYARTRYEPLLRHQMDGRKILMHVSNFRAVKRVRDVVRIFAGVRSALPSVLVPRDGETLSL